MPLIFQKRLGLPSIIIDQARGLLSEEDQDLNAMISDLEQKTSPCAA